MVLRVMQDFEYPPLVKGSLRWVLRISFINRQYFLSPNTNFKLHLEHSMGLHTHHDERVM